MLMEVGSLVCSALHVFISSPLPEAAPPTTPRHHLQFLPSTNLCVLLHAGGPPGDRRQDGPFRQPDSAGHTGGRILCLNEQTTIQALSGLGGGGGGYPLSNPTPAGASRDTRPHAHR
jgi:hypothetical protein